MSADVYRVELMVIDHERLGEQSVRDQLENMKYLMGRVMQIESRQIEWADEHPLNHRDKQKAEFSRLFGPEAA